MNAVGRIWAYVASVGLLLTIVPASLGDEPVAELDGRASFLGAGVPGVDDRLRVRVPSGKTVRATAAGTMKIQGHADSRIHVVTAEATGPVDAEVAIVTNRGDVDCLYRAAGILVRKGEGGGQTGPPKKWDATYNYGEDRLIVWVNDGQNCAVALAADFSEGNTVNVDLGGDFSATYNPAERYTVTLADTDVDQHDEGHVVWPAEHNEFDMGWISPGEFVDTRYNIPVRGTNPGFTKVRASATGLTEGMARAFVGELTLVGGYSFLPLGRQHACVVANDQEDTERLGCTHLYFPADCRIDAKENTNFGILKVSSALPSEAEVSRLDEGSAVPCLKITPTAAGNMFQPDTYGTYWTGWGQLVADINARLVALGLPGTVTLESMHTQLVDFLENEDYGCGADPADITNGLYWLTFPMINTTDFHWYQIVLTLPGEEPAAAGNVNPGNKVPIEIKQTTPADPNTPVDEFDKFEAEIVLDKKYFCHEREEDGLGLEPSDLFDAYEADGNGHRIQVDARFVCGEDVYDVPCFVMKETFDGGWKWKVRFAPPNEGRWTLTARAVVWHTGDRTNGNYDELNKVPMDINPYRPTYHYWGYNDDVDPVLGVEFGMGNHHTGKLDVSLTVPSAVFKAKTSTKLRPLTEAVTAANENPLYFYRSGKPFFLTGISRAWTNKNLTTYLPTLAAAKGNFNSLWFAAWETMLVHGSDIDVPGEKKGHEEWFTKWIGADHYTKKPLDVKKGWRAYSYYDQGRAKRMDEILAVYAENKIYVSLTIWPHDSLRTKAHHWPNHGWRMDGKARTRNGFALMDLPNITDIDKFLFYPTPTEQDPNPKPDKYWLWQKNLYRYIVGRYASSPNLAFWGTVAEVEGVGKSDTYWTQEKNKTRPWHSEFMKTIKALDYRKRPITGWATYANDGRDGDDDWKEPYTRGEETPIQDHGCFTVTDYDRRTGLWAFDSYPWIYTTVAALEKRANHKDFPKMVNDMTTAGISHSYIWHYSAPRMPNWVKNCSAAEPTADTKPYLITEFGVRETHDTHVVPAETIRSYMHFGIWSAFASGHCGTPLKWLDSGSFDFDCFEELTAVAKVAEALNAEDINILKDLTVPIVPQAEPPAGTAPVIIGIRSADKKKAVIWVFHDEKLDPVGRDYALPKADNLTWRGKTFTITLNPGKTYTVMPYNTWSGEVETDDTCQVPPATADGDGKVEFEVGALGQTERTAWDGADILYVVEEE